MFLRFSSTYDMFSMTSPTMPYVFVLFGSQKCAAQGVTRESQDDAGNFTYSCSVDAPQFLVTGCSDNSVPLSLVLETASGEDISRTVVGSFQYLEGSAGEDSITRPDELPKHATEPAAPQQGQTGSSPKPLENAMPSDAGTNTYDYQPAAENGQYGNNNTNNTFQQPGTNDMITAYRSSSFTNPHYHRRVGGWHHGYGSTLGSTVRGSSSLDHHGGLGRHGLAHLPIPTSGGSGVPQLVRTSTISNGPSSSGYHPMSLYSSKAVLKINGKLDTMTHGWTDEEWSNKRRLVLFKKSQDGSTLIANFKPVAPSERPHGSICISCIWWEEKKECFVTSVDTISLLEQLVASPAKFSVEEKNRIRRNLEGFHPLTVSKAKAESEEFFKIIMGFPNPKPRNIEKDVKVFPWKILEQALKKIIGKYSASPSSTLPPTAMMAPASAGGYAALPTPPGHGMSQHGLGSQHADPYSQSTIHSSHDNIPSPRSLSGSGPNWAPYTTAPAYSSTAARTLSPQSQSHLRHHHSPQTQQPHIRINTNTAPLPAVTSYDTRTVTTGGYGSTGLHTPLSHHHSNATPPRWDTSSSAYDNGYSSLSGHHHSNQPVYGTATYSDSAPRA